MDTDIPDFLRIPQATRAASWKGKRPRSMREISVKVSHREEPADVRAFRLAHEKREKEKQVERLALLRERDAEKKRLGR